MKKLLDFIKDRRWTFHGVSYYKEKDVLELVENLENFTKTIEVDKDSIVILQLYVGNMIDLTDYIKKVHDVISPVFNKKDVELIIIPYRDKKADISIIKKNIKL